jgi:hypothetical protein
MDTQPTIGPAALGAALDDRRRGTGTAYTFREH